MVQITTVDERWYLKPLPDVEGVPQIVTYPSVTWITEHYPKGVGFYKWLAEKGWDEAEAIKEAAGDRGSKVHQAIEILINGGEVRMDGKLLNKTTGEEEEIKLEEYEAIMSYVAWHKLVNPKILAVEGVVFNDEYHYAGTIDLICEINGEKWIVDFKTSQAVYPSHEMQVSAYKHCRDEWKDYKLGILQIGYRRNKDKYKFTEVDDKFDLFLAAKQIWANECKNVTYFQKDYPTVLTLASPKPIAGNGKVTKKNVERNHATV